MQIGAIIQARMGSSRLAGKVLKELNGKTVLEHIYYRTKCSKVDKCVVATTTKREDDEIELLCNKNNILCYRGDENDVLKRYYDTAKEYKFDIIVRITSDDPLKDTSIINKAIVMLLDNNYDYVSNTIHPTYPEGIDVEVFSFGALENAYFYAELPSEREHVTPYIWKNPQKFNIHNFENDIDLSSKRWTMDKEDDYEFMKKIYGHFIGKNNFSMQEVLEILKKNPEYELINKNHIRNEGYIKSLKEENENE